MFKKYLPALVAVSVVFIPLFCRAEEPSGSEKSAETEKLFNILNNPWNSSKQRSDALESLGRLFDDDPRVKDIFFWALNGEDSKIAGKAIEVLSSYGSNYNKDGQFDEIARRLIHENKNSFSGEDSKIAGSAIEVLSSSDELFLILARSPETEEKKAFYHEVWTSNEYGSREKEKAIRRMYDPSFVPILIDIAKNKDEFSRAALDMLCYYHNEEQPLKGLMVDIVFDSNMDLSFRSHLLEAGLLKDAYFLSQIVLSEDVDPTIRGAAVSGLATLLYGRDKSLSESVKQCLNNLGSAFDHFLTDPEFRDANLLGSDGQLNLARLSSALDEKGRRLREKSGKAATIGGESAGPGGTRPNLDKKGSGKPKITKEAMLPCIGGMTAAGKLCLRKEAVPPCMGETTVSAKSQFEKMAKSASEIGERLSTPLKSVVLPMVDFNRDREIDDKDLEWLENAIFSVAEMDAKNEQTDAAALEAGKKIEAIRMENLQGIKNGLMLLFRSSDLLLGESLSSDQKDRIEEIRKAYRDLDKRTDEDMKERSERLKRYDLSSDGKLDDADIEAFKEQKAASADRQRVDRETTRLRAGERSSYDGHRELISYDNSTGFDKKGWIEVLENSQKLIFWDPVKRVRFDPPKRKERSVKDEASPPTVESPVEVKNDSEAAADNSKEVAAVRKIGTQKPPQRRPR